MTKDELWLAKVKASLDARGWSQCHLSRQAGINPNTISRWFRGHRKISRVYRNLIDRTLSKKGES